MVLGAVDTLVLSAGGVRGMAFAGAIDELVRTGLVRLEDIRTFVGTSVGAFVCCMLSIGCTNRDLLEVATHLRLENIAQMSLPTLMYKYGLDDQARLREFIAAHVLLKLGTMDATFRDLADRRNVTLRVCASNLTTNTATYFSVATHPDMSIIDATLMSMALPPVFAPVRFEEALYIDGAFLDSFPLHGCDPATTLGLRLSWNVACNLNSLEQVYSRILFCALTYAERNSTVDPAIPTVDINVGDVSAVNFSLPPAVLQGLVDGGRRAVARFILDRSSEFTPEGGKLDRGVDEQDDDKAEEEEDEGGAPVLGDNRVGVPQ